MSNETHEHRFSYTMCAGFTIEVTTTIEVTRDAFDQKERHATITEIVEEETGNDVMDFIKSLSRTKKYVAIDYMFILREYAIYDFMDKR